MNESSRQEKDSLSVELAEVELFNSQVFGNMLTRRKKKRKPFNGANNPVHANTQQLWFCQCQSWP